MRRPTDTPSAPTAIRAAALGALVFSAGLFAVALHRAGHTQGDDFALYLRQARSLFDGDTAAVVADNRFAVLNSDDGFSPLAYPWGWPLLLAPFVHIWGFDYDRLKLVEVAAFCIWLILLHGIVRRRLGPIVAFAFVAVFATAPEFLEHTDQLLTEFPHLAAVAAVIWWYDRIRANHTLLTAPLGNLVALGLLITAAFNIRRESVVLLAVIAVMQLIDVWRATPVHRPRALVDTIRAWWRPIITPFVTFAVAAITFQLLLPTDVLPDNGNSRSFLDDRWGEYPAILADQLGLGAHPAIGVAVLLVATVGAVIGVRRRPLLDTPLLLLGLFIAVVLGSHLRKVDRYWFQVTPWVLYFVTVALVAAVQAVVRRRASTTEGRSERTGRTALAVAVLPLMALVIAHLSVLPARATKVDDFNSAGRVQFGPAHPDVAQVFDAVSELTPADAVIAYYRARTMTLLTDRRTIQTYDAERIRNDTDYWVQRKNSSYWQPDLDAIEARELGFTEVWSSGRFIIWSTGR